MIVVLTSIFQALVEVSVKTRGTYAPCVEHTDVEHTVEHTVQNLHCRCTPANDVSVSKILLYLPA